MTKKGYQRRLPTVLPPPTLPPAVPAPRTSDETVARSGRGDGPYVVEDPGPGSTAPPARTAPPGRRSHRRAAVVLGLLLVIATLALVSLSLVLLLDDEPDADGPGPAPLQDGSAVGAAESHVTATVQADGDVVVRHRIRPETPVQRLVLSLPDVPGSPPLTVTGLQVLTDGEPVPGPTSITGAPASFWFAAADEVDVAYRIHGAVQRSDSVPGRALALATSLDASYVKRAGPEVRVVRGAEVLALACTASRNAPPTPCGTALSPGRWRVELPAARADYRVSAQVNLPADDARQD